MFTMHRARGLLKLVAVAAGFFFAPVAVSAAAERIPDATFLDDFCCEEVACEGGNVQCATVVVPGGGITCYKHGGECED